MIALLRGAVAHVGAGSIVVDVSGVGYLVHMSSSVIAQVGAGQEVLVHVCTQVR